MVKRSLTDSALVYKIQTFHDNDAYTELYQLYIEDIYRFVAFKVPTQADAEELTGDIFLKIWDYLTAKESKTIRGFRAFLYQTARNTITDWYRKKSTNNELATEMHTLQVPDEAIDIIERTDQKIEVELLLQAMDGLKYEYKEVLILKYIEELQTKEIAAVLSKTKTAVRVTVHRATKSLQQILEEKGLYT